MDHDFKLDAGRIILVSATLAILLLLLDAWSHSVPTVAGIALVAFAVFMGLRSPRREQVAEVEPEPSAEPGHIPRKSAP